MLPNRESVPEISRKEEITGLVHSAIGSVNTLADRLPFPSRSHDELKTIHATVHRLAELAREAEEDVPRPPLDRS